MKISFIVGFASEAICKNSLCLQRDAELILWCPLAYVNCAWMQEDMISNWQPAQSLVGDVVSSADIRAASCLLPLSDANISLWICGGKGHKWQLACTPLIFCNVKYFVLWMCQFSPCGHKDFCQETSFFAVLSPLFLWFRLLIHFSSVRSSSEHEYLVFTIGQRTEPRNPSYVYLNDGGQEFLCFFSAGNYSYGYLFLFSFFFFSFPWLCGCMRSQRSPLSLILEGLVLSASFSSFTTSSPRPGSVPKYFISVYVFFVLFCPTSFWKDIFDFLEILGQSSVFTICLMWVLPHAVDP